MDGTENMIPQSGKAVITENGIITDIIPEINVPAGVEKIDLCGEYILPGLIIKVPGVRIPDGSP